MIDAASAGRWRAGPVVVPAALVKGVGPELAARIVGAGETALLAEPLLGLIASRECPGHVLLETLERVPEWVKAWLVGTHDGGE